jgi:hypothetical protein
VVQLQSAFLGVGQCILMSLILRYKVFTISDPFVPQAAPYYHDFKYFVGTTYAGECFLVAFLKGSPTLFSDNRKSWSRP